MWAGVRGISRAVSGRREREICLKSTTATARRPPKSSRSCKGHVSVSANGWMLPPSVAKPLDTALPPILTFLRTHYLSIQPGERNVYAINERSKRNICREHESTSEATVRTPREVELGTLIREPSIHCVLLSASFSPEHPREINPSLLLLRVNHTHRIG